MDFYNVLQVASQKQGQNNVTKRYSLAVGPPKKDPKVKGVQSAAVQAFLRRKDEEIRKKELEEKRKKEQLLEKRKELKHDRKARAMASRTKDNFQGYNGIPIEEKPRKRCSRKEIEQELSQGTEEEYLTEEELFEYSQTDSDAQELDGYEEEEPPKEVPKPRAEKKAAPPMNFEDLMKLAEKKQFEPVEIKVVKKIEERPMTAEELREKEFLERKSKKLLYERERGKMEKNFKVAPPVMSSKQIISQKDTQNITNSKSSMEKHSSLKGDLTDTEKKLKGTGHSHLNSSGSGSNKSDFNRVEKSGTNLKPSASRASENGSLKLSQKGEHSQKKSAPLSTKSEAVCIQPEIMASSSSGQIGKGSSTGPGRPSSSSERDRPGSLSVSGKERPGGSQSSAPGRDRPSSISVTEKNSQGNVPRRLGSGSNSAPGRDHQNSHPVSGKDRPGGIVLSVSRKDWPGGNLSSVSRKDRPVGSLSSLSAKDCPGGSLGSVSGRPGGSLGSVSRRPGGSLGSVSWRPGDSLDSVSGRPGGSLGSASGRPGGSLGSASGRPGGSLGSASGRPGGSLGSASGRPGGSLGSIPGRPVTVLGRSSINSGMRPGVSAAPKPKCTVVSETISSKNLVTRPSNGQMNERRPAPHLGHRPMINPPGRPLPPITSAYKRKIEDDGDEWDSEMDDFIDDGGESQDEISKHIREIFGYDKSKYKDESDYALRYMETSWKDQQKEESRSLRLGMEEDLEEIRREEAELKAKRRAKKLKS
ncbi:protein SPT2 homolog [Microcaecilia unicolor]|uniref:Protein SPT2 homolog n=1 Tax=Microcaecilia unicolor TaxID=1415580 RepID=A0A6P7XVG7_9AMPH|nr:protein SPT2 homolog [Microcaecilia unicolor]